MKNVARKLFFGSAVVVLSAVVAGITASNVIADKGEEKKTVLQNVDGFMTRLASYDGNNSRAVSHIDLTEAAEKSVHAVVHIKSTENSKTRTVRRAPDIYDFLFGDGNPREQTIRTQPRVGFGSGVILSKDGYIVTNNHVIADADEITVKVPTGMKASISKVENADENGNVVSVTYVCSLSRAAFVVVVR